LKGLVIKSSAPAPFCIETPAEVILTLFCFFQLVDGASGSNKRI